MPKQELFIFQSQLPGSPESSRKLPRERPRSQPIHVPHRVNASQQAHQRRRGAHRRFEHLQGRPDSSMAIVTFHPGGLREPHWHPNADEWQYYIYGNARMTVFSTGARPAPWHSRRATSAIFEDSAALHREHRRHNLVFLEMFKSPLYQDLSFTEWLAHTPPELVMAHLRIEQGRHTTPFLESKPVILPQIAAGSAAYAQSDFGSSKPRGRRKPRPSGSFLRLSRKRLGCGSEPRT